MSDPAELQNRVGPVKSQMHRNLAAVVERGENLSLLENRADYIALDADMFEKRAKHLKTKEKRSRMKLWLLICVPSVIVVVILLIVTAIVLAIVITNQQDNSD